MDLEAAYAGYWAALERADRSAALDVVRVLVDGGMGAGQVIGALVVPAQARIGELWLDGTWAVEQEQAATTINEGLVHWVASFTPTPAPGAPRVLVTCGETERHSLPALVVAEQLIERGLAVTYLGGDPDPDELRRTILRLRPRAVLLSASLTSSLAPQKRLLGELRSMGMPVVVGGTAFGGDPRRAHALGATAYAADADEAARLIAVLPRRLAPEEHQPPGPADLEAEWLLAQRPVLVDGLRRRLLALHGMTGSGSGTGAGSRRWWPDLDTNLEHVLGCVAAALATGDETIVVEVRDWLTHVVVSRGGDAQVVDDLWVLLAEALPGHPLARLHLAAAGRHDAPVEPAGADLGDPTGRQPA